MDKKILITGASGFLTAQTLAAKDFQIAGTMRSTKGIRTGFGMDA